ncbi:MAG: transpeptidase family protein [Bacteroidia bacterium]|nr:transpeptidase family protein [Bacteroidia bacterium]
MSQEKELKSRILFRVYFLFFVFAIFGSLIFFEIWKIQYIEGDYWQRKQQTDRVYEKKLLADRGTIFASDGSILAITLPYYRVAVDVTVLRESDFPNLKDSLTALAKQLAKYFPEEGTYTMQDYLQKLQLARQNHDKHFYLTSVKRFYNYPEVSLLKTFPIFCRGKNGGGLILEKINNKRFYPLGDMARITLGLIQGDTVGIKGLEFSFDKELRGKDGLTLVQRISGNVEVPIEEYGELSTEDGHDIVTTLNINHQDIVETALEKAIKTNDAKSGVAILMEVATGKITAMANYPENLNNAVLMQVEPGSTFKIASTIAALEDNAVTLADTIETNGGSYEFFDRTMRDVQANEKLSFRQAIEKSSNIAIARVIDGYYKSKPELFFERLDRMGVLTASGCQLRGEPIPAVIRPNTPAWNGTTLPWLATGYNIRLTPLQLLTFFSAIANGGKMMRPIIVSEIRNNAESIVKFEPEVIRKQIASSKTLKEVQSLLEGVVENGTASGIKGSHYKIAGKTGTARKLIDGEYQKVYRASFVGYFPADNPKYSCIVIVDEPNAGLIYGSSVAGPVFKEISDKVYALDLELNQEPVREVANAMLYTPVTRVVHRDDAIRVYNALNISSPQRPKTEFVVAKRDKESVHFRPYSPSSRVLPNVHGMSAKDALSLLENFGCKVRLNGTGKVTNQYPQAGSPMKKGTTVWLQLVTK